MSEKEPIDTVTVARLLAGVHELKKHEMDLEHAVITGLSCAAAESNDHGRDEQAAEFRRHIAHIQEECLEPPNDSGRRLWHADTWEDLIVLVDRYCNAWDSGNSSHEDSRGWRQILPIIERAIPVYFNSNMFRLRRILKPFYERQPLR